MTIGERRCFLDLSACLKRSLTFACPSSAASRLAERSGNDQDEELEDELRELKQSQAVAHALADAAAEEHDDDDEEAAGEQDAVVASTAETEHQQPQAPAQPLPLTDRFVRLTVFGRYGSSDNSQPLRAKAPEAYAPPLPSTAATCLAIISGLREVIGRKPGGVAISGHPGGNLIKRADPALKALFTKHDDASLASHLESRLTEAGRLAVAAIGRGDFGPAIFDPKRHSAIADSLAGIYIAADGSYAGRSKNIAMRTASHLYTFARAWRAQSSKEPRPIGGPLVSLIYAEKVAAGVRVLPRAIAFAHFAKQDDAALQVLLEAAATFALGSYQLDARYAAIRAKHLPMPPSTKGVNATPCTETFRTSTSTGHSKYSPSLALAVLQDVPLSDEVLEARQHFMRQRKEQRFDELVGDGTVLNTAFQRITNPGGFAVTCRVTLPGCVNVSLDPESVLWCISGLAEEAALYPDELKPVHAALLSRFSKSSTDNLSHSVKVRARRRVGEEEGTFSFAGSDAVGKLSAQVILLGAGCDGKERLLKSTNTHVRERSAVLQRVANRLGIVKPEASDPTQLLRENAAASVEDAAAKALLLGTKRVFQKHEDRLTLFTREKVSIGQQAKLFDDAGIDAEEEESSRRIQIRASWREAGCIVSFSNPVHRARYQGLHLQAQVRWEQDGKEKTSTWLDLQSTPADSQLSPSRAELLEQLLLARSAAVKAGLAQEVKTSEEQDAAYWAPSPIEQPQLDLQALNDADLDAERALERLTRPPFMPVLLPLAGTAASPSLKFFQDAMAYPVFLDAGTM